MFSSSGEWDTAIKKLLEEELKQLKRYSFQFSMDKLKGIRGEIPIGFKIRKIDQGTIKDSRDFNEKYLTEYWGSVTNFLDKRFGFCVKHNNTLASECISIFTSSKFAEMDIVTKNKFRGIGLAQKVAEKFILHCIEKNLEPRWDCDVNNIASVKLAGKLGFENPKEYSVFVRN